MRIRSLAPSFFVVVGLIALLAVPAAASPQTAEILIDDQWAVNCGQGVYLDLHREGWVDEHRSNTTFHITMTYANAAGDTWTYQDTGNVRGFDDYFAVAGHTNDVGGDAGDPGTGDGNYGRWLMDYDTGEYYAVGSYQGVLNDLACAALAG